MSENTQLDAAGLSANCHPQLHRLGHRGSRIVYVAQEIQHAVDPGSHLTLFPIDEVFRDHKSVLIGFGTPNVFTTIRRHEDDLRGPGWDKFAAFMFWRQNAYVANTAGRVQEGVFFELRNLPDEVRDTLRFQMGRLAGKRGPSCARMNARLLAVAGFTLGGGRSLRTILRPSKMASLIWKHGLLLNGKPVDIRVVLTGDKNVGEHFVGVWTKELMSACRAVKKTFTKHQAHTPAPTFTIKEVAELQSKQWSGQTTTLRMNRPTWIGAELSFVWGQQPIYSVRLNDIDHVPELSSPLQPFPGELDRTTKIKKYVLFSKPVIAAIQHFRVKTTDRYDNIPARATLEMLTPSPGSRHDDAVLYNCVITLTGNGTAEARITGLKNQDARNQGSRWLKMTSWIMAKHVLLSGYDPNTVYACEMWTYVDADGERVLCLNNNSGTYKPEMERLEALAVYLRNFFGVKIEISLMDEDNEVQPS